MLRSTIIAALHFLSPYGGCIAFVGELARIAVPDGRVRLEQRLPLCRCCSDDFDNNVIPQPSALEAAPIRRGGRGERSKALEPAAGRSRAKGIAVRF